MKNNKRQTPPNLLNGILISCVGITLAILAFTWLMINRQVESLVIKRTSEYAHSIAKIAADSSAEALLSDDKLQLNLLVQNVAKDPYIKQATIFSVEGQIVTQYPEESDLSDDPNPVVQDSSAIRNPSADRPSKPSVDNQQQANPQQFLERRRNKVFIEQISYQNVTAGWFKVEIDRLLLEKNFKGSFNQILLITGAIAVILFALLAFLLFRFDVSVKQLTSYCQHLLIQNRVKPPNRKIPWLNAVRRLSESHLQHLKSQVTLPIETDQWTNARTLSNVLVCRLEFEIIPRNGSQLSDDLSLAEEYLNKSIQTFGIQSQGDILTGCLVPLSELNRPDSPQSSSLIYDALCFITLTEQLMATLSTQIRLKSCLFRTPILQLEDQHDTITGISIIGKNKNKINQLFVESEFGQHLSLAIAKQEIEEYVETCPIERNDRKIRHGYMINLKDSGLTQQIARQFNFIRQR